MGATVQKHEKEGNRQRKLGKSLQEKGKMFIFARKLRREATVG
jgi:hypothetical protein